jgi:hypothetical protein
MHTITIGLGQQTATHLQFATFAEAKLTYDRIHAAWQGDLPVLQLKDDYHQELTLDMAVVTHILLQDMKKSLEAAIEMNKLQQRAQREAAGGLVPGSVLPFGRTQ